MANTDTATNPTTVIGGYLYGSAEPSQAVKDGRWDVPGNYQGQMVTWAFGAEGRAESGPGALWARVTDASMPHQPAEYFRRVGARDSSRHPYMREAMRRIAQD